MITILNLVPFWPQVWWFWWCQAWDPLPPSEPGGDASTPSGPVSQIRSSITVIRTFGTGTLCLFSGGKQTHSWGWTSPDGRPWTSIARDYYYYFIIILFINRIKTRRNKPTHRVSVDFCAVRAGDAAARPGILRWKCSLQRVENKSLPHIRSPTDGPTARRERGSGTRFRALSRRRGVATGSRITAGTVRALKKQNLEEFRLKTNSPTGSELCCHLLDRRGSAGRGEMTGTGSEWELMKSRIKTGQ